MPIPWLICTLTQSTALPQFLKPTRQPPADALGMVVGFVVAWSGGHFGSCVWRFLLVIGSARPILMWSIHGLVLYEETPTGMEYSWPLITRM
jgi:hypothetical protein